MKIKYNMKILSNIEAMQYWNKAAPLLEKVWDRQPLEHAITIDDLRDKIMKEEMQLWLMGNEEMGIVAAVVTEIMYMPRASIVRIFLCAGTDSKTDWQDGIIHIEKWAKEQGAGSVDLAGRKGWEKVFPDYESFVYLRKEI